MLAIFETNRIKLLSQHKMLRHYFLHGIHIVCNFYHYVYVFFLQANKLDRFSPCAIDNETVPPSPTAFETRSVGDSDLSNALFF